MSSKTFHFAIALMLALPAAAGAQARPSTPAAPNVDALTTGGPQPGRATRDARAKLQRSLGRQAVVSVDPATGTVRNLQRLDGALSAPSSADAATAALDYVRSHATAIGLTRGDLSGLTLAHRDTTADGVTHLRWTQSYGGIPLYGADLRVNLDRANRVINVGGSPLHDLSIASTTPKLSAADALAAVRASVHGTRRPAVTSQSGGARRHTRFAGGDMADLVLVTADGQVRLAWALTYGASSTAHYFAIVDATTGRVVKRENLVLFASALAFSNYPGAPSGGTQTSVDLTGYLSPGATTLSGPNAHAYADVNDNDTAEASEDVGPTSGNWNYGFTDFTGSNVNGCDSSHRCSWNHTQSLTSWQTNKNQNVTQVFWYVNNFHDHLLSTPIGFDSASGNFQGNDPVQAEADDGANILDSNHVDNANMLTFPDGFSPTMQMYLFFNGTGSPFRDINGGDAAAVVYHEYTHGLTSRLDTDSLGLGALFSAQAGAMGEAWSDFYAMDYLVREGLVTDSGSNGDIDLGAYTDATPNQIRTQPMDCPVNSTTNCPGTATAGSGGYTYGDFGNILSSGPEVHADGEIWGETLWDLRQALVAQTGSDGAGSDAAEHLVTGGLRLAPPEPSFLDMRNAILAQSIADGGTYTDLIWQVFANRGMGFLANTTGSADTTPTEDTSLPPAPGGPTGTVRGTVTDAGTGAPVAGATVGFPPYTSAATPVTPTATGAALTGADGTYSFSAPAASYPKLTVSAPGYDQQTISTATVLNDGDALTRNFQLRRDWASRLGGGRVTSTNDDDLYPYAGADRINDQDTRVDTPSGWATYSRNVSGLNGNPHPGADPTLTIQLPKQVDISSFGIDPANSWDPTSSILKTYRIDTSPDGSTWTTAVNGSLSAGDAGRINEVSPIAGTAQGTRYVRFTMLSAQSNANFIDASELEVYGTPTNQLPSGTLNADVTTIQAGGSVHFTASMIDPDSAIAGYDWDFNGDGAVDASTTDPTAAFTYPSAGTFTAKVFAKDSRGGAGTATTTITVTSPTPPPPPPKPTCTVKKLPSSGKKGKLSTTVTCTGAEKVKATLKFSKKLAKKLRLKTTTAGSTSRSVARAGTYTVTIKLTSKVRKAMRSHHLKKLKLTLQVTASPTGGKAVSTHRTVTIRI